MTTTSLIAEQDAVIADIQIAAPPERVFQAITDPGQLNQWFKNPECPPKCWQMDARVGGRYGYSIDHGSIAINALSEFELQGEILECDPPHLLVYTWFGNWHDDPKTRTVVRWELTPQGNHTHLRVTHTGLSNLPVARKDYAGGWPGVVEELKKFVER